MSLDGNLEPPLIEMPLYMPWLKSKAERMGCTFRQDKIGDLSEVPGDVIVNCVGLGAHELCDDEEVIPRGQIYSSNRTLELGTLISNPRP